MYSESLVESIVFGGMSQADNVWKEVSQHMGRAFVAELFVFFGCLLVHCHAGAPVVSFHGGIEALSFVVYRVGVTMLRLALQLGTTLIGTLAAAPGYR